MRDANAMGKKRVEQRDDLTGEHAWSDAGQIIFAVLFFGVWTCDSLFLKFTTPHLLCLCLLPHMKQPLYHGDQAKYYYNSECRE